MERQTTRVEDPFGLRGKGVLVTGATSLISVWTARLLLDAGARVAMTDRVPPEAMRQAFEAFAAEARQPELALPDVAALIGPCDIRNRSDAEATAAGRAELVSVDAMVRTAGSELGRIDVLCNIAGGQEPVAAAVLSAEVFRRTVDRILIGTWNVIHACFEHGMREHGGRILTVTADVEQGYPLMPAMGAARNGLASLHRALATEWASLGITTCVIAPGRPTRPA